jgi:hypothetical protein
MMHSRSLLVAKALIVAMWIGFAPPHAVGKPWIFANFLNEQCKASDPQRIAECYDYLRGVADTLGYLHDWEECFVRAANRDLRRAFLLYASQHPDETTGPAAKLAQEAFTTHFPCRNVEPPLNCRPTPWSAAPISNGKPVVVLIRRSGRGPRNVLIQRADYVNDPELLEQSSVSAECAVRRPRPV